ncbi:GntR family transcriptional regulator [Sporosarcina sp. ANT_H38]|uniref:GntR family transcriptional regulator n=1 Tax=Sporosarcina sp. ANT_H38 TaxID=2597358 RepID=UPI0011F2C68C|nr:GntR family transcriptional regulator [Sporosarcina sp. ANT_H38]KAA0955521.1 GntR family transcriptional regulator [Sporosarcina sp. ANT_H38]
MEGNIKNSQNLKKPLSIKVYDKLYKMIMDGVFPAESQLPSEPELAKLLGVSRMTLRQSLALLQDDGLVKNIHGKGNFITKSKNESVQPGLESLGNPIHKCHSETIDEVEFSFRLDLESDYTQKVLKRKMSAVVAIERWYKSEERVVAYAFTFMAIETVSELGLDLQDEKQLLNVLEDDVYRIANHATIAIKRSTAGNAPTQKYRIFDEEHCDLIVESVYLNEKYPLVYNKFYIPKRFSRLRINASK